MCIIRPNMNIIPRSYAVCQLILRIIRKFYQLNKLFAAYLCKIPSCKLQNFWYYIGKR